MKTNIVEQKNEPKTNSKRESIKKERFCTHLQSYLVLYHSTMAKYSHCSIESCYIYGFLLSSRIA